MHCSLGSCHSGWVLSHLLGLVTAGAKVVGWYSGFVMARRRLKSGKRGKREIPVPGVGVIDESGERDLFLSLGIV